MAEFVVELYVSRDNAGRLERQTRRARQVAELLARDGTTIRYVRSIFMPEDETCFLIYEATSLDAVRTAATNADLRFDRIIEAVGRP